MPRASVILPVYNTVSFVWEAIHSILAQTYSDFELIIIDDGSTDGSAFVISQITDPRVVKIFHSTNQGLVATLNEGFNRATGEYIVRMDSDDISTPDRLDVQISFMDQNPLIDVCGAAFTTSSGGALKVNPASHEEIRTWLLFHCCICHPATILRNSMIHRLNIQYDSSYPHAEDYELWNRLASQVQIANLPISLLYYRQHKGQVSIQHRAIQDDTARRIRQRQFSQLGLELSDEENQMMLNILEFKINPYDYNCYTKAVGFANWVLDQNRKYQIYNQELLSMAFSRCISHLPY
ncbi:glycosyltransferase family 2 protein [Paenibacillus sp. FSL M8-0228]|uniref:Glycosyltransferase family 2 protein n=1 Tax=Paenibacillus polymyxa TaxID=1406 RepID=A0A8I1LRN8_PAEPO|nr:MULTISPECIES: glycosyltransferase family 2 protein [Paenibacillus]KAF6573725.1 glycosyltransferase family 2 protein [Paenibacillus sp. EKM206P]KAF6588390.1 glycosyltransferase family 2 protein [Paenibacillus sp. EKM205P]MBM0634766.1 glycosyltransferase family 2 protein [Paenibacillus polymyxa]MBO3283080.1 glycosyltransferase family 2 protein [Paenibacillus polymyxa]MBP1309422.1 glycosyltransferase involved in cell wall biosynthesis [Paenibacillus sp. 1182]